MGGRAYLKGMTAEALLEKSTRYDRGGKPVEVIIPYEQFMDFMEEHGLDLTQEEITDLEEAQNDLKTNRGSFVRAEDAKRQLGL